MPLFQWTKKYSVGVERFDQDHERLFDLMNQLHDATRVRQERLVLERVFQELVEYTNQHFSAEESAMNMHEYSYCAAHKAEHDELRRKSDELLARHRAGTDKIGIDMVNFLLRWWTDHILVTDRGYADFFAHRKVQICNNGMRKAGPVTELAPANFGRKKDEC